MDIKFSVITPSIGRDTLARTCEHIDKQDYKNWEHIIIYDGVDTDQAFKALVDKYTGEKRRVIATGYKCNDFGHTPRGIAAKEAVGDYLTYIDDDDYYEVTDAFSQLALEVNIKKVLTDKLPNFLIFPAIRFGQYFMHIPPGHGRTVSCQYVHKRIDDEGNLIAFDGGGYGHDGIWLERMIQKYGYETTVEAPPLVNVTQIGNGQL